MPLGIDPNGKLEETSFKIQNSCEVLRSVERMHLRLSRYSTENGIFLNDLARLSLTFSLWVKQEFPPNLQLTALY
jgi:hypothetical protein